jgi:hypothetical protein
MSAKQYVTYEQFGAVGDGKHDDMPAIVAAHAYANEQGLDVVARDDATYYIGGANVSAIVQTSTHFGKAKFVIDDRSVENIKQKIFCVTSGMEKFRPQIDTLCHNQKKVDFPHEGNVYVRVFPERHKVYIRKGLNMNSGSDASDCFIVDGEGNVKNGINWNYESISSAVAFSIDDAPIVIEGGIFTTIANQWVSKYDYHWRGFHIARSNVTVQNVTHYVEGELDHGAPYAGFFCAQDCYGLTIRDCLLTPHKTYRTESKIPGQMVSMGSYEINLDATIGARLLGIRQTRDITDAAYWGLMGSNFCKDFYMEGCVMSRFDAHCGVTDGVIKSCELGYMGMNLIGFGEFTVEDSRIHGANLVHFRPDYGSFFHGKLTVRNCEWVPRYYGGNVMCLCGARNSGDHDFGYECGLPEQIIIDGLRICDKHIEAQDLTFYVLSNYDPDYREGKPYPYGTPREVLARVSTDSGRTVRLLESPAAYPYLTDKIV